MDKQETMPVWLRDFLRHFQVPHKPSVVQAYEVFARQKAENGEAVPELAEVEAVVRALDVRQDDEAYFPPELVARLRKKREAARQMIRERKLRELSNRSAHGACGLPNHTDSPNQTCYPDNGLPTD